MIKCIISSQKNIQGLLMLIDFEKAFDSVSWSFLYSVLDFFLIWPKL